MKNGKNDTSRYISNGYKDRNDYLTCLAVDRRLEVMVSV
jgi:hypothetical protein